MKALKVMRQNAAFAAPFVEVKRLTLPDGFAALAHAAACGTARVARRAGTGLAGLVGGWLCPRDDPQGYKHLPRGS